MSDWNVISGRISLFPGPSTQALPSALELYKKVWENEPANFQGASSPLAPSVAQGTRSTLALTSSVHPSRVDFNLAGSPREMDAGPPQLMVIENTRELHDEMSRIARLIGTGLTSTSILRVATFMQLVFIQPSISEANKALMSRMPEQYRLALQDEEEFICQISRPRSSTTVPNIKLNFINKWSVERFQVVTLTIGMGGMTPMVAPQSTPASVISQFIAATITFDHNNIPVAPESPLSSTQQSSLILEALAQKTLSLQEAGIKLAGFEDEKLSH